jgi:tetratricopeptide (TPR) repeat protein
MKRMVVMMALLVTGGCATTPPPSTKTPRTAPLAAQLAPEPPSTEARAAYAEANKTLLAATQGTPTKESIAAAHTQALRAYDRALAIKPDFMDALNDKAWILATTPDPTLRQPKEALELAKQAMDSIARAGMLRTNREAFAEDQTPGRLLIVATTYAAALAANGVFAPSESQLMVAGGCGASAQTVMAFVVEVAGIQDAKFHTPSTAEMVKRAKDYQASVKQGQPLVAVPPLFDLLSPATRLR